MLEQADELNDLEDLENLPDIENLGELGENSEEVKEVDESNEANDESIVYKHEHKTLTKKTCKTSKSSGLKKEFSMFNESFGDKSLNQEALRRQQETETDHFQGLFTLVSKVLIKNKLKMNGKKLELEDFLDESNFDLIAKPTPSKEKCNKERKNRSQCTSACNTIPSERMNEDTLSYPSDREDERSLQTTDLTARSHMTYYADQVDRSLLKKRGCSTERLPVKGPQRKSWSFTNTQYRDIQRANNILLKRILAQKSTYVANPKKTQKSKFSTLPPTTKVPSAAVNRKKQQRVIGRETEIQD